MARRRPITLVNARLSQLPNTDQGDVGSGLVVQGVSSDPAVSDSGTALLIYNTTSGEIRLSKNGGAFADFGSGGGGMSIGGTVTGGTTGSVLFVGSSSALSQDNANLFWDDTNNRLGVGNASPGNRLHVTGDGRFTTNLQVDGNTTLGDSAGDSLTINGTAVSIPNNLNFDSNTLFIDSGAGRVGFFTSTPGSKVAIEGGTLPSGVHALTVTGTLPDVSGLQRGVFFNISTSSGTSPTVAVVGASVALTAGYTGTAPVSASSASNTVAGTNTTWGFGNIAANVDSTAASGTGNGVGVRAVASASTTGARGDLVAGFFQSSAQTGTTAASTYGVVSHALTDGSSAAVGGFFSLATGSVTEPTHTSSALIADNGPAAAPIFLGRDNGTTVFTIADGGDTTIAPVSGHTGNALTVTGGTLASTTRALSVTGTLSSTVALQQGAVLDITGAGSGSNSVRSLLVNLNAGYTGSAYSGGMEAVNNSAGTGAALLNTVGNFGLSAFASGTTAGHNAAGFYDARNSSALNVGVLATAQITTAGSNVGVWGYALNSTGVRVGGYFTVSTSSSTPTFTSAALIADNSATTSPIFLARDNGTTVFTIADGSGVNSFGSSEVVFNDAGADIDARFESDTNTHAVFLDAGADSGVGRVGFFDSTPDAKVDIEGGTLPSGVPAFGVTGTLSSTSALQQGSSVVIVGAGTDSNSRVAFTGQLSAGYTGAGNSSGVWALNGSAGTGANLFGAQVANCGLLALANGSTSGINAGVLGDALNSSTNNYGVAGRAVTSSAGNNVGVFGVARNGSGVQVGVAAIVDSIVTDVTVNASAALYVSNGDTTAPIALFRDGVTSVWVLKDGGNLEMQGDYDLLPLNDDDGDIGTASRRFSSIHARASYLETPVSAQTAANVNPATSDSRTAYTNEGATAEVNFNLPAAAAGLEYTFVVQDTDGIQITAASGDTIRVAGDVSASGGTAEATTIGNVLRLLAINATEWVAVSVVGTWTVT